MANMKFKDIGISRFYNYISLAILILYPRICLSILQTDVYTGSDQLASVDENIYIYSDAKKHFNDSTVHFIVASKIVRPGQVYRVVISLVPEHEPILVRAFLHRNNEQISSAAEKVASHYMTTLLMQVPFNAVPGNYNLKVEGNLNGIHGGKVFEQETELDFSERFLTILIETNQLVYNYEQTIYIRIILLTTELKPFVDPVDVYLVDSRGFVMKRWVSVYPYLGFVNLEFELPYDYNIGWWKIRVKALGQTEETKILLERWFTHKFDVNVGTPTFILNTEESYTGSILANYTNVATVTGNLTLKVFVKPLNLRHSTLAWENLYLEENVDIFHGTYDFSFSMEDLKQLAMPIPLEKCELEVQAIVGERFQDFVVSAYGRTRVISTKVKLRFLGTTPQIFKPQMPFSTHLAVSYDDFVPLEDTKLQSSFVNIDVIAFVNGKQRQLPPQTLHFHNDRVLEIKIDPPQNTQRLRIRAYYEDEMDSESTTSSELEVLSYHSPSSRFFQITSSTNIAQAGEYAVFHVWSNFYMKSFSYIVISKGIILQAGSQEAYGMIRTITTFSIPVSTEMAPVFHVVAYHISPDAQVIADSVTVNVHAINKKKFILDINMKQERSGNLIELVPRLTSETIVGISGFDSDHISTHGRQQLTPSKILEAMYSFDRDYLKFHRVIWRDRDGGPAQASYFTTNNYAQDTGQTFQFSHLTVFTNLKINSLFSICDISHGLRQCSSGDCYFAEKECDGYKDCEDSTDEGHCNNVSFEDEDHLDFYIYRRNRHNAFFDATAGNFAWRNKIIGEDQEEYVATTAPKGPSAYALSAVAMSKNYGLHILNEPIIFDSTKPFLVIVEAPDTAAIGEQIGILVTVINYQFIEIKAEIILKASDDYRFVQVEPLGIVSSYKPRVSGGELQHLVYVKPVTHLFVHIPVVATKIGEIEITIIGRTQVARDEAVHTLNVVPDGVSTHLHTSLLLDMRNEAYLIRYLDVNITEDPIIPFEETYRRYIFGSPKATVSVIGDVVGAPYPTDFTPYLGLSAIMPSEPVKSGEHIMFDFAYTLQNLIYLRLTNQLKHDVMKQMLGYLNKAYVYQTVFYNNGAYSMFKGEQPSVWLTAYCTRLFHLAQYPDWENYLYIDTDILTQSVDFILKHQTAKGSFYETTDKPWNRKMNPKGPGTYGGNYYQNISLTAHVLITIVNVLDLPGDWRLALKNAQNLAVQYLERMLPQLSDPYQIALVTYALLKGDSVEAKTGYDILERIKREKEGMIYWSPEPIVSSKILYQNQRPFILPRLPGKYDSLAVEATSYALLVYISYGGLSVDQIVKWLNTMRLTDRAFISSQDTIIAMQALTEYSFRTHIRDITNMKVNVESSSNAGIIHSLYVTNKDLAEYRKVTIAPYVWGHVEIVAQGSGLSVLQLDVEYNVDKDFLLVQPPIPSFDLTIKGHFHGRNKSHMSINSCARWTLTSESETSGLAVIEISLPTGYFVHKPDLDRYVNRKIVPRLQRGRVYPKSAVFMFDYLDNMWSCVNFTLQRWYPVANLTRFLKAKVYDYYTPERYKEVIYDDYDLYVLNICEVCGSYQCPYCPFFSLATNVIVSWYLIISSVILVNILKHVF